VGVLAESIIPKAERLAPCVRRSENGSRMSERLGRNDGRRTNDFMRSLGDRLITPHLTSGEQTALAQGTLDLDAKTRTFARERLTIRAYACAGDEARRIESLIRKHGFPAAGLPLFNAVAQG